MPQPGDGALIGAHRLAKSAQRRPHIRPLKAVAYDKVWVVSRALRRQIESFLLARCGRRASVAFAAVILFAGRHISAVIFRARDMERELFRHLQRMKARLLCVGRVDHLRFDIMVGGIEKAGFPARLADRRDIDDLHHGHRSSDLASAGRA